MRWPENNDLDFADGVARTKLPGYTSHRFRLLFPGNNTNRPSLTARISNDYKVWAMGNVSYELRPTQAESESTPIREGATIPTESYELQVIMVKTYEGYEGRMELRDIKNLLHQIACVC